MIHRAPIVVERELRPLFMPAGPTPSNFSQSLDRPSILGDIEGDRDLMQSFESKLLQGTRRKRDRDENGVPEQLP